MMVIQLVAALLFTSAFAASMAVIGWMVMSYGERILAALTMQPIERATPDGGAPATARHTHPRRVVRTTMVIRRANPQHCAAAA